jgi:replicative DNA helicase
LGDNELEVKSSNNIQSEICLVGSLFKKPDLYVSYGNFMRSQYDFSDETTRFFYNMFELMYTTFSQTIDENKVNIFMSQDEDRLHTYKRYKGFKTIQQWVGLADENDFKNYYNIVKKYSLIREYERNGYPVQKMLNHPKFDKWLAQDIYKIIRSKADKINTVINACEESIVLNNGNEKQVKGFLLKPDMGLPMPWDLLTEMFRGCRTKKVVFNGFLSNEGKTRNMMLLIAYIVLVQKESFLLLSNEMDEDDLRNCLITTVINNPCFRKLHGINIYKCEKEIVLGIYHDKSGNVLERLVNDDGEFIETEEEYTLRVETISDEFNYVSKVAQWIDKHTDGKLFFKDVGTDYSDEAIEFEFRKHRMIYGVKYAGYDTLKGFRTDDWQTVKQTATKIKELMKEIDMFCWAVFQLTDDTVYTDIFSLSSNNISNAKQIKHVADMLMLGKKLDKSEYHKYQYISVNDWGEPHSNDLSYDKVYFALKVDKNRGGNKDYIPVFEINLDYNLWNEVGYLIKKEKV